MSWLKDVWKHNIAVDRMVLQGYMATERNWRLALVNSAVISQITFWSTLGAVGVVGLLDNPAVGFLIAIIPSMTTFFSRLAMELNMEKKK